MTEPNTIVEDEAMKSARALFSVGRYGLLLNGYCVCEIDDAASEPIVCARMIDRLALPIAQAIRDAVKAAEPLRGGW